MARQRHGPIFAVENVLIVWTNEQRHGIHIFLNQVMSFAKGFSLLAMRRNRRRQTPRSLQKQKIKTEVRKRMQNCNTKASRIFQIIWLKSSQKAAYSLREIFNPLSPELNPICYLLALLGAHHFLHVSRIRVKLLTFRLLMSYIYGAPVLDVSRSHTTTQHSR